MTPNSGNPPYGGRHGVGLAIIGTIVILIIHAAMRGAGLFGPPENRPLILGSFLLLWATPFLLLSREDRTAIGLARFRAPVLWARAFASGAAISLIVFVSAWALYGTSAGHPFASVRNSFLSGVIPPLSTFGQFLLFTGPALIFSPIGEEFFCRGVIARLGEKAASPILGVAMSAFVFASLHLMHHGIVRSADGWSFMAGPGALWFAQTFAISIAFSMIRRAGGSIWLAVAAHAGFNLVMNAIIFSLFV